MNGLTLFLLGGALGIVLTYGSFLLLMSLARSRVRRLHMAKLRRSGWPV